MIELSAITSRIKAAMRTFVEKNNSQKDYMPVIETDFEHDRHRSKLDEKDPNMNKYGDFTDTIEYQTCQGVMVKMEAAIKEAFDKEVQCRIVLPEELMAHISQDVIRMSAAEPCGVRGCVLNILLKEKDTTRRVATVFGNHSTNPTFEIYLTLVEDSCALKKLEKVFLTIKGCLLNSQWTHMPKILCSAYQLEKRRLYRRTSNISWRSIM